MSAPVPDCSSIPVHSERQALDWSLVLVSQGIESLPERDEVSEAWRLVVAPPDYTRALRVLRLYRKENPEGAWQQSWPWPALIFDWRCLVVLLGMVLLFVVEAAGRGDLRWMGRMDNLALRSGDWWRPLTAVTLHADLGHLAANCGIGFLFLGLAMGAFGPGVGLLASYFAGVAGFVAGVFLLPDSYRSVGASGMILGALGLLTAQWVSLVRHGLSGRQLAARGVVSGCLLLILLGLNPAGNTDVMAHAAGFTAGLALGAILAFLPGRWVRSPWVNLLAAAVFAALVLVAWARAIQ
jgi:rhomboid protease GluP